MNTIGCLTGFFPISKDILARVTFYMNVLIFIYRDELEFMFGSTNRSDNTVVARARSITIVSID